MNRKWTRKHTRLIEKEDDLLAQLDTCQMMMASIQRFVKDCPESLHFTAVRKMVLALHKIDKRLQDELLLIRLAIYELQKRKKKRRLH